MTHVELFLQQFEQASVTGTGSYVIDTLSCQQQRKMYDRVAVMRLGMRWRGWGSRKRSWEGDLLVEYRDERFKSEMESLESGDDRF